MVVYMIKSPSGKVYIGRTTDFNRRMIEHKSTAVKSYSNKYDYALYKAIRKYGWDRFETRILFETDDENMLKKVEEEFIIAYDSVKRGYNNMYGSDGGDIWLDRKDTDEYIKFIEKMMVINKGENNGMYGKNHKKTTTDIMKQKAKGRFSLQWYIDRNGVEEGNRLYEERCQNLKNRKMPKDQNGKFTKRT
jgi:group I intron endonuclease